MQSKQGRIESRTRQKPHTWSNLSTRSSSLSCARARLACALVMPGVSLVSSAHVRSRKGEKMRKEGSRVSASVDNVCHDVARNPSSSRLISIAANRRR